MLHKSVGSHTALFVTEKLMIDKSGLKICMYIKVFYIMLLLYEYLF